jgi:outer membrane biosynthesis protein TonB
MFDNVGKDLDEEARKRSAASLLVTTAIIGGVLGASLLIAAWKVTEAVIEATIDDSDMVEVAMDEPEMDELPPPPPPPPLGSEVEEEEEDTEEQVPTPDEMTEEVVDLKEEVKEEIESSSVKGSAQGIEGGVEGGVAGGVVGGVEGGVLGGSLGVRTFHHSEVEVKKRITPSYPDAAADLNLGDVDCRVRVFIDTEGVPYDVVIEACPKVFHDETRNALLKWRWYPAKADGAKVRAQFQLVVRYKQP